MASGINQAVLPRMLRVIKKAATVHKVENLIKNRTSFLISNLFNKTKVIGSPPVFMVETASVCNLHCPCCASGAGMIKRNKPFVDSTLLYNLVDELYEDLWMILFWNQGEPFLHPDLFKMIRYASDRRIYTQVSTNGHFLQNYEKIFKSGLDELIISLDGATKETYEIYRVGGDFDKVVGDTANLMKQKKERKIQLPHVTLQFVISRQNEHEIKAVETLARQLGVDELIYKTMEITTDKAGLTFLPENKKYRRYQKNPENWFRKNDGKNCSELWSQPVLNSDGTLGVCCFDKQAFFKPGNYEAGRFIKQWHGTEWTDIREKVRMYKGSIHPCNRCSATLNLNYRSKTFS